MVASAQQYVGGPGAQKVRRPGDHSISDVWQNELWDMYDAVPEFHSACNWVGNLVSRAQLEIHKDGKLYTGGGAPADALASLFGGAEGQEEMLRLLGIHFTVAGESWVIGEPGPDEDEWYVAASTEVQETTHGLKVEGAEITPGGLSWRMWKAHPRKRRESDCPARSLIPTLHEIVRLTQVIDAQATSRLKGNGILFVPSELEMPAVPITAEELDGMETTSMQQATGISEGVTQRLIKIAATAIRDRDSAAASVPLVIAAPGEYLEKVNWVDFWTGFDEHVKSLRQEAVERIGIGMDMPKEALTGTGGVNHWGAWQIEEAAIKIHTEPLLNLIVSSLTVGYLHPWLQSQGVEDWRSYTFEANNSRMRMRPNRSKEAVELYDRGELNARRLLIENGFDPETDAPDERERIMHFMRQLAEKTSASPDQLAAILDRIGIRGIPADDDGEGGRGVVEQRRSLEEHPTRDIPERTEPQANALIVDGLVIGAEQVVYRALERAGNKLRAKVGRKVGATAAEAYLSIPTIDTDECEYLLQDAWTSVDRLAEHAHVPAQELQRSLQDYTMLLLRSQRSLTTESLARHLMLDLASAAA